MSHHVHDPLGLRLNDPSRKEETILSIEINGTFARIVRESWTDGGDHSGERFWVEVGVGVFTPEQAESFAQAVKSCSDRAKSLRDQEEARVRPLHTYLGEP